MCSTFEGQLRKLAVHGTDDAEGMAGPIQEVGVAERDVGCARQDQMADILKDGLPGDHEVSASIDRRDGTVEAYVEAASARLHISGQLQAPIVLEMGVPLQTR